MLKKIQIIINDNLLKELDKIRGDKSRSEFLSELIDDKLYSTNIWNYVREKQEFAMLRRDEELKKFSRT